MKKTHLYFILPVAWLTASVFGYSKSIESDKVDDLLTPYFALQRALSIDNLMDTHVNARQLLTLIDKRQSWGTPFSVTDLRTATEHLASSKSLDEAREAFNALSQQMIELVEKEGILGNESIYKMSCSMAFQGKGAQWLQNNQNLTNPYFGVRMYHCGTIENQLGNTVSVTARETGHGPGCSAGGCCQK
ncbi:MAG: DUF3347 domain-containing protein [Verrucomicrobiae bacterium]|nr:DUF3347 domain-containing protein [Verrucomicrobiae bacterium]